MKKLTGYFLRLFFKDTISKTIQPVVEHSLQVLVLQIIGVLIVFAGNVLVARWYGESVYGQYSHLFNWVAILTVFAELGMEDQHVASLPGLYVNSDLRQVRRLLRISVISILAAGLVTTGVFLFSISIFTLKGFSDQYALFSLGLWLVLPAALAGNLAAFLRGSGKITGSQIPEKMIRPLVFLGMLALLYFVYPSEKDIDMLILSSAVSLLASITVLALITGNLLKRYVRQPPHSSTGPKPDFKRNTFFLGVSLLYLLTARLDILSLGFFGTVEQVGYYNVALKIADIVAYPMIIMNIVIPTYLSRHHHINDEAEIFRMLRYGSVLTSAGCLLIGLIALVTGRWLMGLYGPNFIQAYPALIILCCSHLVTAFSGPVCAFFMVSGRERFALWSMAAHVMITAICCILFIPAAGVTGAALASLAGNLVFNLLLVLFFYRDQKAVITPFRVFRYN